MVCSFRVYVDKFVKGVIADQVSCNVQPPFTVTRSVLPLDFYPDWDEERCRYPFDAGLMVGVDRTHTLAPDRLGPALQNDDVIREAQVAVNRPLDILRRAVMLLDAFPQLRQGNNFLVAQAQTSLPLGWHVENLHPAGCWIRLVLDQLGRGRAPDDGE